MVRFQQGVLFAAALLASATTALAADDDIKLGPVTGYSTEAQAAASCPDGVVWADRKTGFYYPKFSPDYGVTPDGTFTCYKQAKKADYWGLGPLNRLADRVGPAAGRCSDYTLGPRATTGGAATAPTRLASARLLPGPP